MSERQEPNRKHLPATRPSVVCKHKWQTSEGQYFKFHVVVGFYDEPDDRNDPAEVFVKITKHGSDTSVSADGWATMVSVALQFGVPWEKIRSKFVDPDVVEGRKNMLTVICDAIDICVEQRKEEGVQDAEDQDGDAGCDGDSANSS
jgi:hypothetical protein